MDEQNDPRQPTAPPGTPKWSDKPVVRPPLGVRQPTPSPFAPPGPDAAPEANPFAPPAAPGQNAAPETNPFAPPAAPGQNAAPENPFAAPASVGPALPPPASGYDPFARPGPEANNEPASAPGAASPSTAQSGQSTPPPRPAGGYDPFARPAQPPPGEPPAPAGPQAAEPGDGGGRRPLLIAGAFALALVIATVAWIVLGNRTQPNPEPSGSSQPSEIASTAQPSGSATQSSSPTQPASSASSSDSAAGEDGSGIPYEDSTRTPPWTPTRDKARVGMAPVTPLGEPVEVIESTDEHGLVTILEHVWSDGEGNRVPAEGKKYLLIHVEIEALDAPFTYAPGRFMVIDQDFGRYSFFYASAMQEKYPLIHNGVLPAGKVLRGWVLFELPQQDVTVSYQAYSEEGLRVQLDGGPAVPHSSPEIALDETFTDTSYNRAAEVQVLGATWFTDAVAPPAPDKEYLAVLISVTATQGSYYATALSFELTDASGATVESFPVSGPAVGPPLLGNDVAEGDTYTGWVYFEVARGDVELQRKGLDSGDPIKISG